MFFFPLSFITSSSFKCYNNNLQNGFLFPPWVTKEFTIKETFYIFKGITKIFNEECFFYCLFIVYLFFLLLLFFFFSSSFSLSILHGLHHLCLRSHCYTNYFVPENWLSCNLVKLSL